MGDQAPPNFNPSVSLLSGGESVPITAVQGGGSLADVSMLSGGEGAIIVPVKGGAGILKKAGKAIRKRLGFKSNNNLENVEEVNMSNEAKNARKGPPKKTEEEAEANLNEEVEANRNEERKNEEGEEEEEGEEGEEEGEEEVEEEEVEEEEVEEGEEGEEIEEEEVEEEEKENEESLPGSSDEAQKDIKISVDGLFFEIRPYNEVTYNDWENAEYSEGEKNFKDALELTDELLKQTFGEGWKGEFAKFLKNIGYSSCFKDSVLLTKAECEDTRIFTQKVHLKLYENLLKKFELENDTSNSNSTEGVSNEENDEERKKIINEQDGGRRKQRLPSIGGFKSLHL